MEQLALDGQGTIYDQIELAASIYGPVTDIADFASWCRKNGYLNMLPLDEAVQMGDIYFIKERAFKQKTGGLRRWICTGEGKDGSWISRRFCTSLEHLDYCRLLKKKRDDITSQLVLELEFRKDREWQFTTEDAL